MTYYADISTTGMEATGDAAFENGTATTFTAQPRNAGFTGFYGADLGSSAPTAGRVPAFFALARGTGGIYLEDHDDKLTVAEAIHKVKLDVTVRHNKLKVVETEFVLEVGEDDTPQMVERETGRLLDLDAWRATVGYPNDGGEPVPYAPTSPGYAIMQNEEALAVGDELSEGRLRAIGAFGRPTGARVYGAWEIGEGLQIDGDPYRNFVTILASHDRSSGTTGLMTPIRLGCTNQTTATFGRHATPRFTIRHTGNPTLNVQEARRILGLSKQYTEAFTENMQRLLTVKMTTDDFIAYERKAFGVVDFDDLKPRQRSIVEVRDEQLLAILGSQTCAFGEGTVYPAWQAIVEYSDFYSGVRGKTEEAKATARAEKLLNGGTNEELKTRAWNIAAELVAA